MNKEQSTMNNAQTNKAQSIKVFLLSTLFFVLCSLFSPLFAATYDLKEMTPEIQQALNGRRDRFAELQSAKQAGAVRENSQGLVSGAEPISSAENRDRLVIYRAIAEQNNLGAGGLEIVQQAFAEVHKERSR